MNTLVNWLTDTGSSSYYCILSQKHGQRTTPTVDLRSKNDWYLSSAACYTPLIFFLWYHVWV